METWKRQFIRHLFHYSARHRDIEAAHRAKDPHVPTSLYKYRMLSDKHKDALSRGVLWRCSPERFNDPYDSFVTFDQNRFFVEHQSAQDFIAEMKRSTERGDPWIPKPIKNPIRQREWRQKLSTEVLRDEPAHVRDAMLRAIESWFEQRNEEEVRYWSNTSRAGLSVVSVSENPKSVLMWSHYSDSHKGFCIEYDLSALDRADPRRRLCYPVFYRRKVADVTRYLARRDLSDHNNLFGTYVSLLKSDEWAYEREWRIVLAPGQSDANNELAMPTPKTIILAALVQPCHRIWMRAFCNDRGVALKQVVQRHNEFRLEIQDADA
jgi:hypothetical protein